MNEEPREPSLNFTNLAADIVSAYVSNNPIPPAELPALIAKVHEAVSGLATAGGSGAAAPDDEIEKPTPTQVRKSIRDDGIMSFIDGRIYKTLKRHLSSHGLDPRSYRERYGLPADYPMVAPSYAAQRSALAKAIGLGQPGAMAAGRRKGRKTA
ncbi:MucR family transcriptional regulator (plasmid) [Methylobacterium sp. P31]